MVSSQIETHLKALENLATQIFVITLALSKYGNPLDDLPKAEEDAKRIHELFEKLGVPEDKISHLVNPDQVDFFAAIKKVKELAQNGEKTQLFLHYAGHGKGNGGYIAMFGPHTAVNLSDACFDLSRAFPNVWVLMVLDACAKAEQQRPRVLHDFTGAAAVGAFKTVTISACRLGKETYCSWQFTKSFAEFMAEKVVANKGLFKIPEDVFEFEGPNGEHELSMTLTKKTFITLQFPIASQLPKKISSQNLICKRHVYSYTENVAEEPDEQNQEHPVREKLNWFNPLNGVCLLDYKYAEVNYQFISVDGTRSAFESSAWTNLGKFVGYTVPKGKQIRKVETLLRKRGGLLLGFKWFGDDGVVLVATTGWIDMPSWRNCPQQVLQSLTLKHNQRLVGVRSSSVRRSSEARNYQFQWVICTEQ